MDQALWNNLPAELLEQVLPFLLVPDLCRFRIVCRRWNDLICSPEFGKLSTLNASKSAQGGAYLVVKVDNSLLCPEIVDRRVSGCREVPGWSILDLNEKRWYNLERDLHQGCDLPFEFRAGFRDVDVLSVDGGLVCAFVDSFTEEQRRDPFCIRNQKTGAHQTLVMFNLFGGASKVLPNPPLVHVPLQALKVKLIVENTSNTFKIVLMRKVSHWNIQPKMSIYESSTDQWRSLLDGPTSVNQHWEWSHPASNAIFQGLLYVLYQVKANVKVLCSFNFLEDSWEDTGVQLPQSDSKAANLVVSDNRLFLMSKFLVSEGTRNQMVLGISEILLADKECRTVVRMDAHLTETCGYETRAFGFNKSILVIGSVRQVNGGKMVLYNLETGQWESLPQNSLERPLGPSWRLVTQTDYLRLPNAPW